MLEMCRYVQRFHSVSHEIVRRGLALENQDGLVALRDQCDGINDTSWFERTTTVSNRANQLCHSLVGS